MTHNPTTNAMKPGINSTGGPVTARAESPAGHFSDLNAVETHGTAGATGRDTANKPDKTPAAALIEDDGFITVYYFPPCGIPRNHAEEIANAKAESERK